MYSKALLTKAFKLSYLKLNSEGNNNKKETNISLIIN